MKFTLSWLKDHLDTDEPLEKLADKLTMIGLEVEHIEDKAKALAPIRIARVISAVQHPNADRLRVCMVDIGDGGAPVQVVCGAPNARDGLVTIFGPPGTYIPGKNITLSVGTIRGVESRGMLISGAEIEVSNDHDGIIELPTDAPVGASYVEWAKLGDPVIEINLTPNRQDATGVHGIARDLAAADMKKVTNGASLRKHLLASHTTTEDIGRIAAIAKPKLLVLSHLVPGDDETITDEQWTADVKKHFSGKVIVAKDLMELPLPV